ncbi:MAG TPA: hypothetical protein VKA21_15745 [Candidatus Binatia bacterium]|nr:hypothetical protein [Candidatus Binatia bacterium]
MQAPGRAASAFRTWALAVFFVLVLDAAITRTSVLWGRLPTEDTINPEFAQIAQTYKAARKLFHDPGRPAAERVAVLGDSRVWFPAHAPYVERALARLRPDLDVRVDDLGIFGVLAGDLEVLSRHLDRLDPTVVVLGLGPANVMPDAKGRLGNVTAALLDTGWRDGPIPPPSTLARVDRWGRTVWPLYRFRELARGAIEQRVSPSPPDGRPLPDAFQSRRDFFAWMYRERAEPIAAAYEAWRAEPSLDRFVAYLRATGSRAFVAPDGPLRGTDRLAADGPAIPVLDALLARLAEGPWQALVMLLPENPILDQDTDGRYHDVALSDRAAAIITTAAARHDLPVVDARRWLPAESFFDLVHLFPDLGSFEDPFAKELIRILDQKSARPAASTAPDARSARRG